MLPIQIEGPKAVLLANSEFWGSDWDLALSRDVFRGEFMHGVFEENAEGYFPRCLRAKMTIFLTCLRPSFLLLA